MSRPVASIKITEAKSIHIFVNSFFQCPVIVFWGVKKLMELNWGERFFPNGAVVTFS